MLSEKMTPRVRQLFDDLDDQIARLDDRDQRAVWEVLSGLRGPDMDHHSDHTHDVKEATTEHIRTHAFPKWAAVIKKNHEMFSVADAGAPVPLPNKYDWIGAVGSHFTSHALQAMITLGLIEENPNEQDEFLVIAPYGNHRG